MPILCRSFLIWNVQYVEWSIDRFDSDKLNFMYSIVLNLNRIIKVDDIALFQPSSFCLLLVALDFHVTSCIILLDIAVSSCEDQNLTYGQIFIICHYLIKQSGSNLVSDKTYFSAYILLTP